MLWLIWIGIMLLTPVLAGIGVWWQTHTQREVATAGARVDDQQSWSS